MNRLSKFVFATALGLLMAGQTFAATGGSFYTSQLSSIGTANTSYGRTSDGLTNGYTLQEALTNAIDLQAGDWATPPHSTASAFTTVDQPSFMEWDLPSGTFNAKTVIAFRNSLFNFSTSSPWHLEVFNGGTWNPIGVSGAGAPSDGSIAMGNTSITNGTKIRAIYDHLNNGGSWFLTMGEILVLPDSLQKVPNSYTATASSQFNANNAPSMAIDNQLGNTTHTWFSSTSDSNPWLTLSFTTPANIDALLLSKYDNFTGYNDAIVDIYANGTLAGGWTNGTKVAGNVDMSSPEGFASFNVFKFDTELSGVNNLSLKFIGSPRSGGGQGLEEIIPLIPEPSTVGLVILAALTLVARRNQKQ